jgi:hypothetical protein
MAKNALTGNPLPGVEVALLVDGEEKATTTDGTGNYELDNITVDEATDAQVRFRLMGLADLVKDITLVPGEDQVVDANMAPPSIPMPPPPMP